MTCIPFLYVTNRDGPGGTEADVLAVGALE